MNRNDLERQLLEAQETIRTLQEELVETNSGLLALTLELEQRVEARTAELRTTREELEKTNIGLIQLTAELEDRVAARTAELQQTHDTLEQRVRERTAELQRMVNLMAGREVRMAELKAALSRLRAQLATAGLTPVVDDPLGARQEV